MSNWPRRSDFGSMCRYGCFGNCCCALRGGALPPDGLAGPESREQIQRVLATIAEDAQHEAGFQNQHDYEEAQAHALAMRAAGELERSGDFRVCQGGPLRRVCGGAGAALRRAVPLIESLMQNGSREGHSGAL